MSPLSYFITCEVGCLHNLGSSGMHMTKMLLFQYFIQEASVK